MVPRPKIATDLKLPYENSLDLEETPKRNINPHRYRWRNFQNIPHPLLHAATSVVCCGSPRVINTWPSYLSPPWLHPIQRLSALRRTRQALLKMWLLTGNTTAQSQPLWKSQRRPNTSTRWCPPKIERCCSNLSRLHMRQLTISTN